MSLHEDLRALTDDVPRRVHVDAAAAWATARRRRVRRAAAVLVVVVVVAVTAVAGLRGLTGPVALDPADGSSGSSLRLPARIDHPLGRVRDLPRKGVRVAGVVYRQDRGWFAVSPRGRLWRLPLAYDANYPPAVAEDGSTVAFLQTLADGRTRYLVWDVTAGLLHLYSKVGDAGGVVPAPPEVLKAYMVAIQTPAFISPDGTAVFVSGDRVDGSGAGGLVLRDGTVTRPALPEEVGPAHPAGWLDDAHLVWVDAVGRPTILVTSLSGEIVRRTALAASPAEAEEWGQWVGPVSPDRSLVTAGSGVFRLSGPGAGRRVANGGEGLSACPAAEAASDPAVVAGEGGVLLERAGARLVVADPRLGIDCSVWATQALRAPVHHSVGLLLWGRHTWWLTWWWRESTAGLLVVAVGVVLVRWRRRRRLASGA